jgi:hypothetical protein
MLLFKAGYRDSVRPWRENHRYRQLLIRILLDSPWERRLDQRFVGALVEICGRCRPWVACGRARIPGHLLLDQPIAAPSPIA